MSKDDAASEKDVTNGDATPVDKSADSSADTAGATTTEEVAAATPGAAAETVEPGKADETVEPSQSGTDASVVLNKASDSDAVPDQAAAAPSAPAGQGRNPLALIGSSAAAVVLVAALITVFICYRQSDTRGQELDERTAATQAACGFGQAFTNFSADRVDEYLKRVAEVSTGEWKSWVEESGPELEAAVVEKKISSRANDVQCGFESGDDRTARVVLVIDQSFSSELVPGAPNRSALAAVVDMEKSGGKWLVAKLDTPALTPLGK